MRFSGKYGTWQLDDLPGCSQVCVSHSAFVLPDKRREGFGTAYHQERLRQIADLKYDCAIATVADGNEYQKRILTEARWTCVHKFKSRKTGHYVGIWVKDI